MKHKTNVAKLFGDANRYIPIQLNGIIGNNVAKRPNIAKLSNDIGLVNIENIPPANNIIKAGEVLSNIKDLESGK